MGILKRSLKAYIISFVLFTVLTLFLACIICFSNFKESWTFAGLILILTVDAILLGIMQGMAVGKKGLIIGALSAMLMVIIIVGITALVFNGLGEMRGISPVYILPVVAGAIGGAIGINRK